MAETTDAISRPLNHLNLSINSLLNADACQTLPLELWYIIYQFLQLDAEAQILESTGFQAVPQAYGALRSLGHTCRSLYRLYLSIASRVVYISPRPLGVGIRGRRESGNAVKTAPAVMQSPPAILTRAQSPPAVLARAQSPPVLAALVQSPPPPTVSHKPSTSVEAPPRPPRAVGPRAKPVRAPSETEIPDAPITLPLTPPRRIWAEPDVPTTPTTPALSAFPTPPRSMKNVTAGSSSSSM
ncbi:hypothetical protein FRC01_001236, partial [Tulasnella sp. 417]